MSIGEPAGLADNAPPAGESPPAAAPADAAYRAQARGAAEKFEGFFIAEMMKQMRRSTRELGGDDAIFADRGNDDLLALADGMVADALSGQRAFGVADAILRQLLPAEAPTSPVTTPDVAALNAPPPPVALDR